MKQILLYIWQAPQHVLGLLLIAFYRPERMHTMENGNQIHFSTRMKGGISLGKYSIVNVGHYRHDINESLKRDTVRHEAIGHARQSLYLGWFYLLVIGLQSALHAILCACKTHNYHDMWFEKWADKLAGVKR